MTFDAVDMYLQQISNVHGLVNVKNFRPSRKRLSDDCDGNKSMTKHDILNFMVNTMKYSLPQK